MIIIHNINDNLPDDEIMDENIADIRMESSFVTLPKSAEVEARPHVKINTGVSAHDQGSSGNIAPIFTAR